MAEEPGLEEVEFSPVIHLPLDEPELGDLPSVWLFDQPDDIEARTALISRSTLFAKNATKLARPRAIQTLRSPSVLRRIISWNAGMVSRTLIKAGTRHSTAAIVTGPGEGVAQGRHLPADCAR